jgi:hypothetical protein
MSRTLADALKGMKTGKDENDCTSGVKIKVQKLKEDRHAKVLKHIQLVISMVTLRGFGHVLDGTFATALPPKHSDKDEFVLSDPNDVKKHKAIQAKNNAITWLRMAFPSLKHQHEINACTAEYPQGVAHDAVRRLKARVISAKEMTATVLRPELDTIDMKESDNLQSIDD